VKKKKLRIERLNMKPQIQEVLDIYDYHLRSKGFTYTFDCPDPLWFHADKEALIESFINLLDNSIKYSEDTKHISIVGGKTDSYAYISVKDAGVGISKRDQKYIFDKFYRVPKGNLARTRGTGLGLAFVKQLVEEQKGKVSVQSVLGEGSTFTLYYPLD
jgi:two-component system phosphate regulon sensor histidine kinase PhoR